MSKTFLIIGGYGNTGILISDFLLKYTDSKLIIAGRNHIKAEKAAKALNEKYFDDRVKGIKLTELSVSYLAEKFKSADMIIIASSTTAHTSEIAKAVIKAKKDYLDINLSSEKKILSLMSLEDQIVENKLLFFTDCGFHPGIPAALIRYAAQQFDKLEIANVGCFVNINWKDLEFSESTVLEMANEFKNYNPVTFRDNLWKKLPYKKYKKFDFDNDYHRITCAPMMLEELRNLPSKYPYLRELGFYISGFNPVVNYFIIPSGTFSIKVFPKLFRKPFAYSLLWGLKKFSRPPFKTIIKLSAIGRKRELTKEISITISHKDGYWLTAASVTALLIQYLRGKFTEPGLFLQGNIVDPAVFLNDIEALGVDVVVKG